VRNLGKPYAFALNGVKTGTTQATEAAMVLSKYGTLAGVIAHRMAVKVAWNDGRTAVEIEPRGKAAEEMRTLWDYVAIEIGLATARKKEKAYA